MQKSTGERETMKQREIMFISSKMSIGIFWNRKMFRNKVSMAKSRW